MNDEDRQAFDNHWNEKIGWEHGPERSIAMGCFAAALSHRNKRIAELEAVVATQAKIIQALRDCEAAEAARMK